MKRLTCHGCFRPRVWVAVWNADVPKAADLAPDLFRAETLIDSRERREEEVPFPRLFGRLFECHSVDEPAAGFVFLFPACCLSVVCHLFFVLLAWLSEAKIQLQFKRAKSQSTLVLFLSFSLLSFIRAQVAHFLAENLGFLRDNHPLSTRKLKFLTNKTNLLAELV